MVTVLDDDYFPGRRLDDDCSSPKHEVFAEEHAIVKWALGGIDRVLRYAIPTLVGWVGLKGALGRPRVRLGVGLRTLVA